MWLSTYTYLAEANIQTAKAAAAALEMHKKYAVIQLDWLQNQQKRMFKLLL